MFTFLYVTLRRYPFGSTTSKQLFSYKTIMTFLHHLHIAATHSFPPYQKSTHIVDFPLYNGKSLFLNNTIATIKIQSAPAIKPILTGHILYVPSAISFGRNSVNNDIFLIHSNFSLNLPTISVTKNKMVTVAE